jgi:hypothetical protein
MNPKVKEIIIYTTLIIIGFYFLVIGLSGAKGFLIPFTLAVILAMVLLPVENRLRKWGLSKGLSALLSVLLLLGFCVGLFFVLSTQIKNVSENWPEFEKKLKPKIEQVQAFVSDKTGLGKQEQEKKIEEAIEKSEPASAASKIIPGIFSFGGNFLLVFVYIFFFSRALLPPGCRRLRDQPGVDHSGQRRVQGAGQQAVLASQEILAPLHDAVAVKDLTTQGEEDVVDGRAEGGRGHGRVRVTIM